MNSRADIDAAMNDPPRRVQILRVRWTRFRTASRPSIDLCPTYVSGLETMPADGRFLLVGNHTQFVGGEVLLIPHFVRRALGSSGAAAGGSPVHGSGPASAAT